jgi:hypothetical protein
MENQGISQCGVALFELVIDNMFQRRDAIQMQFRGPAKQMKGIDQTDEPVKMVAVKVRDKDMADPKRFLEKSPQLHLGSFTAIQHHNMVFHLHYLGGGVPVNQRDRRAGAKYGDSE